MSKLHNFPNNDGGITDPQYETIMLTNKPSKMEASLISNVKVFISGPMSGIVDDNKAAFDAAEDRLKRAGFDVFNPAWLTFTSGWDRNDILTIDMVALSKCDAIYQLDGWEKSKGAIAENSFALSSNKIFLSDDYIDFRIQKNESIKE
jgi:hypothetical protein